MELFILKRESDGIPLKEMEKASSRIEDLRQQLDSGNEERARITLQRASFQIKLLKALADEAMVKGEKEKLSNILNRCGRHIEVIVNLEPE